MKSYLTLLCLALTGIHFCPTAGGQDNSYLCHTVAKAPDIDGNVTEDPVWQPIAGVTGFFSLGGGYTIAKQSTAKFCWDTEALFVAVICEEPDAATFKPLVKDWGWTWTEDGIEVFLQPGGSGQVYQFGVTAGGAKGSGESSPDIDKCTAAARIVNDSYSTEIRIPYSVLNTTPPRDGDTWRGTVCRNIMTTLSGGDKFTSWSRLEKRFLEPHHFAVITFTDQTPDAAKTLSLQKAINHNYRDELVKTVRTAAAQATEHTDGLRNAATGGRFSHKAKDLLNQWTQITTMSRQTDVAPAFEMRRALLNIRTLAEASHEVTYKHLLDQLFDEE